MTAPSVTLSTLPSRQLRADRRMSLDSVINITQGALISATASLPTAMPRLLMLSMVTTATSCSPPARVNTTSALTAPGWTWLTLPLNTLRALTFI
ncbi:hypothetical protein D9M71_818040 [compost metagenome]